MAKDSSYVANALRGGSGPSESTVNHKTGRPDQVIRTPVGMDNVDLAMDTASSIYDGGFRGGVGNLDHSLKGATAVTDIGAAGPVKRVILPNH